MSDNSNLASILQRIKLLSDELQALTEQADVILKGQSPLGASDNSFTKAQVYPEQIMESLEKFMTPRSVTLPNKVTYDRLGRILHLFWVEPTKTRMKAGHVSKRLQLQPISADIHFLVRCGLLLRENGLFSLADLGRDLIKGRL